MNLFALLQKPDVNFCISGNVLLRVNHFSVLILYRPDYYAKELLGTIFSMLNGCNSLQNDEGICAILIDTLAILCESEVVDMVSTWDALASQFSKEKRYYFKL